MVCPSEFKFNCYYAATLCHKCKAGKDNEGNTSDDLKYKPLAPNPPLESHPEYSPPDKRKSREGKKNNKLGRKTEARVSKVIGARHNISSQGFDAVLEALQLRLEIKCRVSPSASPWPTKEEWGKAQATGIDIFILSGAAHDKEARVCMSLDTLKALLEAIDKGVKGT